MLFCGGLPRSVAAARGHDVDISRTADGRFRRGKQVQSLLGSSFLKKDVESAQSGSGPGAGLDVGSYVGAYVVGSHDGCAGHVPHASGQASDASRVSDTKEG